jgi:hypothetical protein
LKVWTKTQGTNDDLKITDRDFVDCKVLADTDETGLIYKMGPYSVLQPAHMDIIVILILYALN